MDEALPRPRPPSLRLSVQKSEDAPLREVPHPADDDLPEPHGGGTRSAATRAFDLVWRAPIVDVLDPGPLPLALVAVLGLPRCFHDVPVEGREDAERNDDSEHESGYTQDFHSFLRAGCILQCIMY